MAGDGFVGETVWSVRAVDQEIGGTAAGTSAELAMPRGVACDHHFVRDFGELIAGDIDDDALGLDPRVTLTIVAAYSVDVLGAGESIGAQVMA